MSTSLNANSVILDNVDDYLAPSQACVNPLFQPSAAAKPQDGAATNGNTSTNGAAPAVVVPRRRRRIQRKSHDDDFNDNKDGDLPAIPLKKENGDKKKDAVKASMADCLACSGCVTTAETVLMEQRHSLNSLRKRLMSPELKNRARAITISPNSWADLCRHWNLSSGKEDPSDSLYYYTRFTTLLSTILSAKVVVDGNVPLQWTWIDEAREFCQVYKKHFKDDTKSASTPTVDPLLPSVAIDCNKTQYYQPDGTAVVLETRLDKKGIPAYLPLISGSCPALVCLVEKTLTNLVPHLSQTISPMSLVGMVLKEHQGINASLGNGSKDWDHWAIMPCHDKKLEASRKDFFITGDVKEQAVDLVISTQECVELVEEWIRSQQNSNNDQSMDSDSTSVNVSSYLQSLSPSTVEGTILEPHDLPIRTSRLAEDNPLLITTPVIQRSGDTESAKEGDSITSTQKQMAFASGGHANFIFLYAAKVLFDCNLKQGVEWKASSLVTKNVRSARLGKQQKQHYYEAKLYRQLDGSFSCTSSGDDPPVLHFGIAHGMQTMQRALKQLETKSTSLHYLEAMACPHGCVNGGGSARSPPASSTSSATASTTLIRETPTETRSRVQSTLKNLEIPSPLSRDTHLLPLASENGLSPQYNLPRTGYHVVPPMQLTTGAVAGEKVENIQW